MLVCVCVALYDSIRFCNRNANDIEIFAVAVIVTIPHNVRTAILRTKQKRSKKWPKEKKVTKQNGSHIQHTEIKQCHFANGIEVDYRYFSMVLAFERFTFTYTHSNWSPYNTIYIFHRCYFFFVGDVVIPSVLLRQWPWFRCCLYVSNFQIDGANVRIRFISFRFIWFISIFSIHII